jgi:hypothetical protein
MIRRFTATQPGISISENLSVPHLTTCGSTEKEAGGIHRTPALEKMSHRALRDGTRR